MILMAFIFILLTLCIACAHMIEIITEDRKLKRHKNKKWKNYYRHKWDGDKKYCLRCGTKDWDAEICNHKKL